MHSYIPEDLVKLTKQWIGLHGIRFFRNLVARYGTINCTYMDHKIPHSVHFREGMYIRNFMRDSNLCNKWTNDEIDNGWIHLINIILSQERFMDHEKEINNLVDFIKEKVTKAGKTGCIIGISGGIDSAVIACLCKLAFPKTTYGISMATVDYKGDSTKRAKELCLEKDICLYHHYIDTIQFDAIDKKKNIFVSTLSKGNYYARQRMATLYLYAENFKALVIGTDNKCEQFLGFFTKYGDGGVDINPLGQYYKSEIYELGYYLNVPESIMKAIPSAELWEDQTDEDEIGLAYHEIEEIIRYLTNEQNSVFGMHKVDKDYGTVINKIKKIKLMHEQTHHKRIMPEEYIREG